MAYTETALWTTTTLVGIGTISVVLYRLLNHWYDRWSTKVFAERGVPHIPLPSQLVSIWRKEQQELTKDRIFRSRNIRAFGTMLLGSKTIVVADADIAEIVFSREFTNFVNRRILAIQDPMFSSMVSNAIDDNWKRYRTIITPTFSASAIRRMKPRIDETVRMLLHNFAQANANEVDVKRMFGAFTMDTIIQVSFGVRVDSLADPDNAVIAHARKVFSTDLSARTFINVMIVFMFPRIAKLFGVTFRSDVMNFFSNFAQNLIEKKKTEMAATRQAKGDEQRVKASDFLEMILEAELEQREVQKNESTSDNTGKNNSNNPSKKYMTTQEIVAQCVLFFLAGYDTTATTLTIATYLLALHPEKQEKLYEEIDRIMKQLTLDQSENESVDPIELITLEHLNKFEYLSAVVNETLRLYSPAQITERTAAKDIVLQNSDGSLRISARKGDVINIPIYTMHHDERQFPEPYEFRPERFLRDETGAAPTFHKYSYIPFGAGPRNCIAKTLALIEAKLALLHSIRCYRFSKCDKTKVPFEVYYQNNFLVPRDIVLRMEKRNG